MPTNPWVLYLINLISEGQCANSLELIMGITSEVLSIYSFGLGGQSYAKENIDYSSDGKWGSCRWSDSVFKSLICGVIWISWE